ncbi:hypothetical protein DS837_30685 [Azospirillum brasilense]|uniref:NACHT domain-containing protein n=1 Tax=Azospirillum brasilense TaxID=192 RepID=A0A6L3ARK0_AZOBR|nr:hypothetical protein DS837_30685 [Azospirillum brasilense]
MDANPSVAVEAKRYGQKTALGLDQLKAKLVDAVGRRPDLDLLIFGATREISRDDQDELVRQGEALGIGVVAIDWPKSATILPPLGVLCALVPEVLLSRITDPSEAAATEACLKQLRAHPGFQEASDALQNRLTRPDMGWSAARRGMADWLRQAFASRNDAMARLHGLVNLLDTEVRRVPRPRLMNVMDGWWAKRPAPLVLLGEEGVGKSWAPLAWWHERAGADGAELPLTLVVPARDVTDTDVHGLVARLLAQRTGLRNEEFWRRRVTLWLKSPMPTPRFLLVFDGLNEHWSFRNWANILAQLTPPPWRGQAAVVLTCRPDHWTQSLHGLAGAEPPPEIHRIEPFDDAELDALLRLHNLSRSDFAEGLIPLLKVPRLCDLAIRHRRVLAESGDITRERLVYEDWKDRVSRRGSQLPVSDSAFQEFVAGLGQRLRAQLGDDADAGLSVTRAELTAELGAEGGHGSDSLRMTVSEIIDGRWMRSVPGKANRFRLNKNLMPYALGMALVEQLRELPEAARGDELAAFLEPLREQDLAVDLLRAAVTVALVDSGCSASLRQTLLDAWFHRQNFRSGDFETFWRLLPQDCSVFFALAEETWLRRRSDHQRDEVLIKGFAKAADRWPALGERIVAWCSQWLGTHWDDPRRGMVLGYRPEAEGVADRCARTRERRASWDEVAGSLVPPIPIRDCIDGDVFWLACRVLGILSYLPRAQIVPALTAWAVSRAIMGEGAQADQVAWILRLPYHDNDLADQGQAMREGVRREAERLLELKPSVALEAARLLLEALATPDAARQVESLKREETPSWVRPSTVTVDGAGSLLQWDFEAARTRPPGEKAPLEAASDLSDYAIHPDYQLSDADAARLRSLADTTDAGRLWLVMSNTSEDIAVESAEAALARWAPESLGDLYRRLFAGAASRTKEALDQLAFQLPAHLLLLGVDECSAIKAALHSTEEDKRGRSAETSLMLATLIGRTAAEQIGVFLQQPNGPDFESRHHCILAVPNADDFARVAEQLQPDAPVPRLCGWLWYLCHVRLDAMPPGYPPLLALFNHADSRVRQLALKVVCNSNDAELAAALADTSWRCTQAMDRNEVIYGSFALTNAAGRIPAADIRLRIDPQAWGFLALREDATEQDLDVFADFIGQRINDHLSEQQTSTAIFQQYFNLNRIIDRLVERRGARVVEWVQPLVSGARRTPATGLIEDFPYIDICRALLRHRPVDGAALWTKLRQHHERGLVRSDSISLLPFEVPEAEPIDELRHYVCDHTYDDYELSLIATAIIDSGQQGWLIRRIERDLSGSSAGQIARGLWLAGLLDASDAADHLWRAGLANPPAPGWLADVHALADRQYRRNIQARRWLDEFLEERDRDRAFGRHLLFLRCADRRAYAWAPERLREAWDDLPEPWRLHWNLCFQDLKTTIEKRDKKGRETLFGTKITSHIQWPWR